MYTYFIENDKRDNLKGAKNKGWLSEISRNNAIHD